MIARRSAWRCDTHWNTVTQFRPVPLSLVREIWKARPMNVALEKVCPLHQKATVRRSMTAEEWEAACEEVFSESAEVGCDEGCLNRFGFA
jgi:hypothetical protein